MPTVPEPLDHTAGLPPLPGQPFQGSLPTIRFATGSVFVILGLSAVTGLSTGQDWLARGAADWIPMDMVSALVFLLFGGIMMISRSNLAREASWVLMLAIGALSLGQHYLAGWTGADNTALSQTGAWLRPVPAVLFFITGLRIYFATRKPALAPVLDGVILGLSVPALVGYMAGFSPLYQSSIFHGISVIEALGFSVLGALFLLADIEYARLDMRAWKLPAALGVSALAATTSIRVTEAVLDGFGRSGLQGLLSGQVSPEIVALAATNVLMAFSIGTAAMLLLISRDSTHIARRETERRRLIQADFARTTDQLAAAHDRLAAMEARIDGDLGDPAARLGRSADQLVLELESGRTGPATATAREIGRDARRLAFHAARIASDQTGPPTDFAPETLAFEAIVAAIIAQNRTAIRARGNRVLTEHADGTVRADPTRLQQALHLMLAHALDATRDSTPLISIRLDRTDTTSVVRMAFSAGNENEALDVPAFELVRRIADWHGGSFANTKVGRSRIMELKLPNRA